MARDTVNAQNFGNGFVLLPQRGGTLTLGPNSETEVLPDTSSTATAVDSQQQLPSQIALAGQKIELQGGSQVRAAGGQISITASTNPSNANTNSLPDPSAQLRIDSGAVVAAGPHTHPTRQPVTASQ